MLLNVSQWGSFILIEIEMIYNDTNFCRMTSKHLVLILLKDSNKIGNGKKNLSIMMNF